MIFEGSEKEQRARGIDADRILQNPVFDFAEREATRDIHEAWEQEEDPVARDRLWHAARAIGAFRQKLEAIRANGEHAGERIDAGL